MSWPFSTLSAPSHHSALTPALTYCCSPSALVQHVHPHHASAGVNESMPETQSRLAIQQDSVATYPGIEQTADPHLLLYMWRICQGSAS